MLQIGWATRGIIPDRPAMIQGQMHVRIAKDIMDPLTVTAMAIADDRADDSSAILASLDVALISTELLANVRQRVAALNPSIPTRAIILFATHTHTSMVFRDGFYPHPGPEVMTALEVEHFLADRVAQSIVEAWSARAPASIGRAFGNAVVAHNRRPHYADGSTRMYGPASDPSFVWIEGFEDHSLDILFVWDAKGSLSGILLDIPCPSQVDEHLEVYSADFWHEIRVELRRRLGAHLWVLPVCGPAGDQSPHFILYSKLEEEMRQRRGLSERQEIALRVAQEVERALACTRPAEGPVALAHRVDDFALPARKVTKAERDWSEKEHERAIKRMDPNLWWPVRLKNVVDIYDGKVVNEPFPVEIHVLRLGDVALATNPFELFVDFGHRIKARSAAKQTFLTQLTNGTGMYLPTERAAQGGGYGAMPVVSHVGPEGGAELVEHTVKAIASLFAAPAKG